MRLIDEELYRKIQNLRDRVERLERADPALGSSDPDAIHDNVSGEISAITEKASPVSGDLVIIEDSAASYAKKKVQLGNLPAGSATDNDAIHDNVASEISAITNKANPTDADYLLIEDAAATNAKKHITIANLFEGSNPDFFRLEEQGSAPSTPASGYGALYGKTDGQLYWKNDAGAETNLTWGTSATWTPQLTQNTSVLTTTVTGNYYILTGKLCIAHARIAYVSGTTANQPIGIGNLPATPATNDIVIGSMVVFDSGTAFYHGAMRWVSVDSKAYAIGHNQGNWIGISPAFSLASGDWVNIQLCYITA